MPKKDNDREDDISPASDQENGEIAEPKVKTGAPIAQTRKIPEQGSKWQTLKQWVADWINVILAIATMILAIATMILAIATFYMAAATKETAVATKDMAIETRDMAVATRDMADTVRQDFIVRNSPNLITFHPDLVKEDDGWKIDIKTANQSTGRAIDVFYYYIFCTKNDDYIFVGSPFIEDEDGLIEPYFFPVVFLPMTDKTHTITIPINHKKLAPERIRNAIVILKYKTLLDKNAKLHCDGFVCERDGANFDAMSPDKLKKHLLNIKERKTIEEHLPAELLEEFIENS